ncbi:MAG: hypothetical protein NVSMB55_10890 [Mycobacteriales bacterium]
MNSHRAGACAVLIGALALAGCGSGTDLSSSAAAGLQRDTAAVSAAARAGDAARTSTALASLRADVGRGRAAGELSPARAGRILDAAARVALDVVATHPAPPARPQVAPPAQPQTGGGGGEGD